MPRRITGVDRQVFETGDVGAQSGVGKRGHPVQARLDRRKEERERGDPPLPPDGEDERDDHGDDDEDRRSDRRANHEASVKNGVLSATRELTNSRRRTRLRRFGSGHPSPPPRGHRQRGDRYEAEDQRGDEDDSRMPAAEARREALGHAAWLGREQASAGPRHDPPVP